MSTFILVLLLIFIVELGILMHQGKQMKEYFYAPILYKLYKNNDMNGDDNIFCDIGMSNANCKAACDKDKTCGGYNFDKYGLWTGGTKENPKKDATGCCLKRKKENHPGYKPSLLDLYEKRPPQIPVTKAQASTIERGLDVQENTKPVSAQLLGWQSTGIDSMSQCSTLRSFNDRTLANCKEVCLLGDSKQPGNNGCNTINYMRKTDKTRSMCSTHKCADVNLPQLIDKTGYEVFSWFGTGIKQEPGQAQMY